MGRMDSDYPARVSDGSFSIFWKAGRPGFACGSGHLWHGLVYPEPGSGFPGSCRNTHARDYGDVGLDGRRIQSFFITQYHHGDGQCSSQKLWYRIQFSGHHADHGDAVQHDHYHPGIQTYHGGPRGECGNTIFFSCQYASLHDDLLLPLRGRSILFHGPLEACLFG